MGKAIKRVVRSVTKPVEKAVKAVGKAGENVVKGAVGVVTGKGQGGTVIKETAAQAAPPPAQLVEPPKPDEVDSEGDASTEADRKKARAGGKKSLSVARSSGGGINI